MNEGVIPRTRASGAQLTIRVPHPSSAWVGRINSSCRGAPSKLCLGGKNRLLLPGCPIQALLGWKNQLLLPGAPSKLCLGGKNRLLLPGCPIQALLGWEESTPPAGCPIQALLGWEESTPPAGCPIQALLGWEESTPPAGVPHPSSAWVGRINSSCRGAPSKLCLGGKNRLLLPGCPIQALLGWEESTPPAGVPHPSSAWVGRIDSSCRGAPSKLCLGGKNRLLLPGCPIQALLGWEESTPPAGVPHPSSAWVGRIDSSCRGAPSKLCLGGKNQLLLPGCPIQALLGWEESTPPAGVPHPSSAWVGRINSSCRGAPSKLCLGGKNRLLLPGCPIQALLGWEESTPPAGCPIQALLGWEESTPPAGVPHPSSAWVGRIDSSCRGAPSKLCLGGKNQLLLPGCPIQALLGWD